jgi:hypothetical protein
MGCPYPPGSVGLKRPSVDPPITADENLARRISAKDLSMRMPIAKRTKALSKIPLFYKFRVEQIRMKIVLHLMTRLKALSNTTSPGTGLTPA